MKKLQAGGRKYEMCGYVVCPHLEIKVIHFNGKDIEKFRNVVSRVSGPTKDTMDKLVLCK